jgi:hypothetical protein
MVERNLRVAEGENQNEEVFALLSSSDGHVFILV